MFFNRPLSKVNFYPIKYPEREHEPGMQIMCEKVRTVIKSAAEKLTGRKRRAYQAEVTAGFFGGSARKAEQETGWGRISGILPNPMLGQTLISGTIFFT